MPGLNKILAFFSPKLFFPFSPSPLSPSMLNGIHESAIASQLAHHDFSCLSHPLLFSIASSWLSRPDRGARQAANFLWACAKVRYPVLAGGIVHDILSSAVLLVDQLDSQQAGSCLWSIATLGLPLSPGVELIISRTCVLLPQCFAQTAANTLWALATMKVVDPNIVQQAVEAAVRVSGSSLFLPRHASIVLWSLATLSYNDAQEDSPSLRCLVSVAVSLASSFSPQESSNALWAVASLGITSPAIVDPLLARASFNAANMETQHIANCLWALATCNFHEARSTSFLVLLARAEEQRLFFKPQEIANTLWALGVIGIQDVVWIKFASSAVEVSSSFSPRQSLMALWGIASLSKGEVAQSLALSLLKCTSAILSNLDSQGVVMAFWCVAVLKQTNTQTLLPFLECVISHADRLSSDQIARVLWSCCQLSVGGSAALVFFRAVLQLQTPFLARVAVSILHSAAFLNVSERVLLE